MAFLRKLCKARWICSSSNRVGGRFSWRSAFNVTLAWRCYGATNLQNACIMVFNDSKLKLKTGNLANARYSETMLSNRSTSLRMDLNRLWASSLCLAWTFISASSEISSARRSKFNSIDDSGFRISWATCAAS